MKKVLVLVLTLAVLLAGCGSDLPEIRLLDPISLDEVAGVRLLNSQDEVETQIFNYITRNFVVEASNLISVDISDIARVEKVIDKVDEALAGGENKVLSEDAVNYLLLNFGETPFKWERTGIDVLGFDASSRYYFVDVTYKTVESTKRVVPTSRIPNGSKDEVVLKENRLADYLGLLSAISEQKKIEEVISLKKAFEKRWGRIEDIYAEQQGKSLYERVLDSTKPIPEFDIKALLESAKKSYNFEDEDDFTVTDGFYEIDSEDTDISVPTTTVPQTTSNPSNEEQGGTEVSTTETTASIATNPVPADKSSKSIGVLTYSGRVKAGEYAKPAEIVIRYVMGYRFNLGEVQEMEVKYLYVKNFKSSVPVPTSFKTDGSFGVLSPFIDRLIHAYHKAIEEYNEVGLFELMHDYGAWDKYFADVHSASYFQYGGYTFSIIGGTSDFIDVLVKRSYSERHKGAKTSLPVYEDEVVYRIARGHDDKLRVAGEYLLTRKLVGEPLSVIRSLTSISDMIQYSGVAFTKENEVAVFNALKAFSKVVASGNSSSQDFAKIVDYGVSSDTLRNLASLVGAFKPSKKLTYLVNYSVKSNVFVSLVIREVFQTESGVFDIESVVELVNRDGSWRVSNYTRRLAIKLDGMPKEDTKVLITDIVESDGSVHQTVSDIIDWVEQPTSTVTTEGTADGATDGITEASSGVSSSKEVESTETTGVEVTTSPVPTTSSEVETSTAQPNDGQ